MHHFLFFCSFLFSILFVICILCRHSCTGEVCMINNRVYYVELLFDSNCVSSFLEKGRCAVLVSIIPPKLKLRFLLICRVFYGINYFLKYNVILCSLCSI